ncbi:hypothetical protein [Streptomyces mirabilis]|uniref:hypothetical protein n=1 Tax=Streptomyces mirabilis TaxID=68239 RepID=UPI003327B520
MASQAAGEHLAEVADMPGCGVQLGAAGQDVFQGDAAFLANGGGMAGEPTGHLPYLLGTAVVTASGGRLSSPEMPGEEIGGASGGQPLTSA